MHWPPAYGYWISHYHTHTTDRRYGRLPGPIPYIIPRRILNNIISYPHDGQTLRYRTLPGPIPYIIIPRHILNIEYRIIYWILNIVSPSILLHVLLKSSIIMLWYGFWFLMIYLMSLVRLSIIGMWLNSHCEFTIKTSYWWIRTYSW